MANMNKEVLDSFVKYCEEHPHERFWQALRNWSGYPFILASTVYHDPYVKDTFYWTGKGPNK